MMQARSWALALLAGTGLGLGGCVAPAPPYVVVPGASKSLVSSLADDQACRAGHPVTGQSGLWSLQDLESYWRCMGSRGNEIVPRPRPVYPAYADPYPYYGFPGYGYPFGYPWGTPFVGPTFGIGIGIGWYGGAWRGSHWGGRHWGDRYWRRDHWGGGHWDRGHWGGGHWGGGRIRG